MKKLLTVLLLCGSIFLCQTTNAIADDPPVITGGPYLACGYWPPLPIDPDFPIFIKQNCNVLWTFSDDFETCNDECTHRARYKKIGGEWKNLAVIDDPVQGYAYCGLPVEILVRNKTYKFEFSITDCAGQTTTSPQYYFAFGIDMDLDSVPDEEDNCPGVYNPNQGDGDRDGIGDCCDQSPGCGGGCGQYPCDTTCSK
ncbi:MAG: hypothetical protein JW832_07375 [Deltaproteobacteria bacterium]|nr:hypothetical protein [Deltaproteobacteria bacterium]